MKKILTKLTIVGLMLLPGISAYADTSSYLTFNTPYYSGVTAYTNSGSNYTNKAVIYINSISSSGVSAWTQDINKGTTTSKQTVSAGQSYTYSGVTPYVNSGDSVRASFIKYNFNGTQTANGRFYYNW